MNNVKQFRESLLMTKAELARKAELSALTINRIEQGAVCRISTMRKIILAFGLKIEERNKIFP